MHCEGKMHCEGNIPNATQKIIENNMLITICLTEP